MKTTPSPHPTAQELRQTICVPCSEQTHPLESPQLEHYLDQLDGPWECQGEDCLEAVFEFEDFNQALGFANEIGELVEAEGHPPDLSVRWGEVVVDLQTPAVRGLTENDFIMAAKIERLYDLGHHAYM